MTGYVETLTSFEDLAVLGWDKAKIVDWIKTQKHMEVADVYLNDGFCEEYGQHCVNCISGPPELVLEVPIDITQVVSQTPFDNQGDTAASLSCTYQEFWDTYRDQKVEVVQPAAMNLDSPFHFSAFSNGLSVSLQSKKGHTKSLHQERQYKVDQQVVVAPVPGACAAEIRNREGTAAPCPGEHQRLHGRAAGEPTR
ncbi:hypothetical protein Vafri_3962 [Volvox africanus]|uniref:Uncharacterized protein n=1 Tax=Volvox africanus TaxID=51714 RepID=A0A8J4AUA2_9CHLO|nr:hypothetical protein Vafri_3962 [Volvox africanus]